MKKPSEFNLTALVNFDGGVNGARTRDLQRDRLAF
jgi:hypothetical protein